MTTYKQEGFVKIININPPTEKEIEKILHSIVNKEGANFLNVAFNKF